MTLMPLIMFVKCTFRSGRILLKTGAWLWGFVGSCSQIFLHPPPKKKSSKHLFNSWH